MATRAELMEADFVCSAYCSEDSRGTRCGMFPCDYSEVVRVNETGEEYRYCEKLGMRVSDDDTCKYHRSREWEMLVGQWVAASYPELREKGQEQRKESASIFRLVLVAIFCVVMVRLLN